MRTGIVVWHGHIPAITDQGNRILRQLRIAETPFGKLGYVFRRKPTFDIIDVRKAVVLSMISSSEYDRRVSLSQSLRCLLLTARAQRALRAQSV